MAPGLPQLAFLPDSDTLTILTDDSRLTHLSISSASRPLATQLRAPVESFALDRSGNYAAATLSDGSGTLYDAAVLRMTPPAEAAPRVQRMPPHELLRTGDDATLESGAGSECSGSADERIEVPMTELGGKGGMQQFDRVKLKKLLNAYGEYPHKYRLLIWEFLLQLPRNRDAFDALASRGLHPCAQNLSQRCASNALHSTVCPSCKPVLPTCLDVFGQSMLRAGIPLEMNGWPST